MTAAAARELCPGLQGAELSDSQDLFLKQLQFVPSLSTCQHSQQTLKHTVKHTVNKP